MILEIAYKNKHKQSSSQRFCLFVRIIQNQLPLVFCFFSLTAMSFKNNRNRFKNHYQKHLDQSYHEQDHQIYNSGTDNEFQAQQSQYGKLKSQINSSQSMAKKNSNINEASVKSKQQVDVNSLGYLTKKFIQLVSQTTPKFLDISEAAKKLNVQKRRIYDITNVLQGIGYIQKLGKNQMRWIGGTMDPNLQKETKEVDMKVKQLQRKKKILNAKIKHLTKNINSIGINNNGETDQLNYFQFEDCQKIMQYLKTQKLIVYVGKPGSEMSISQNTQTSINDFQIEANQKKKKGALYTIIRKDESQEQDIQIKKQDQKKLKKPKKVNSDVQKKTKEKPQKSKRFEDKQDQSSKVKIYYQDASQENNKSEGLQ